ncbi:MAG: vitamin K-dependent gamma-carboxylase [Dehalococcoidia bacterium]|nr:vitamin K-dependent gamma-carboxylase [Dehalococcoidia bacterium]
MATESPPSDEVQRVEQPEAVSATGDRIEEPPKQSLIARLLNPVDIASIVFFRIFFGIVSFWHVWEQVPGVKREYIDPDFHFSHFGLSFIHPLPGELMNVVFLAMAASTIFIALGFYYRWAAAAFFLLHTYAFLIDQSGYWNHYYLTSLIAFLMIFVPAHRAFSLDVARGAVRQSDFVPAWTLWILRAQMGITYFFAGLAKINSEWMAGRPMDHYLENHQDFPLIGRFFTEPLVMDLATYLGMSFDLLVLPLLLWKPTRYFAMAAVVGFHLFNSLIFNIEVFPWLAIAATLLFLEPGWPRLGNQWRRLTETPGPDLVPVRTGLSNPQKAIAGVLAVYFLVQVLMPLRHYAYPGNTEWTSEGYFFSWRMLLADKEGRIQFHIRDKATGDVCRIDVGSYVAGYQASKLSERPDMMVQFANRVADRYMTLRGQDIEVYAWSEVTLNGRPYLGFIDPTVDLTQEERSLGHHSWIIPLDEAREIEVPAVARCPERVT